MALLDPHKTMMAAINKHQPDWSGHDRQNTMGGSESAACARRFVYAKEGVPEDAGYVQDPGAFERGHALEDWWTGRQAQGLAIERANGEHDIELLYTGANQRTLVRGPQSATPDGLWVSKSGDIVIEDPETKTLVACHEVYCEVKSKDPRTFERQTGPEFAHIQQCIQGMDLMQATTEHSPQYAVITYINASFVSQQRRYVVKYDADRAAALVNRAQWLLYNASLNDLPDPEGRMYGGGYCEYCPWAERCETHDNAALPSGEKPISDEDMAKIAELSDKRIRITRRMQHLENLKSENTEELKVALTKAGSSKVRGEWGSTYMAFNKGRSDIDTAAMEADGIDPKKYMKSGKPFTTITVRGAKVAD